MQISRRTGAVQVRCNYANHRRGDLAAVKNVALHNDAGVPFGGSVARGWAEVELKYVALPDVFHQQSWIGSFALRLQTESRSSGLGTFAYA